MDRNGLQRTFGIVVRGVREQRQLSQEELADLAGLHRTYISLLERGQRNPSLDVMSRIAAALDTTPSAILLAVEKNGGKRS